MKLRRHVFLGLALLAAATGASGQASSTPPDEVPRTWQVLGEDVTAPSPARAVVPVDQTGATVAGLQQRPLEPIPARVSGSPLSSMAFGTPLPPSTGVPVPTALAQPVSLGLPSLGIEEATVRSVGVEPDGAMEIPPAHEVGWYRFGPGPGQQGSQVLAAHIASDGIDGVFRHLERLQEGDLVKVTDAAGVVYDYEIVGLSKFEKQELPFDDLFRRDGPERLVLITCGGDFNRQLRSYDSNVVAFAVPATT